MIGKDMPLQPMDINRITGIHPQSMEEAHNSVGGCLRRGCEAAGGPYWSTVLTGTCRPMERGAQTVGAGFLVGCATLWKNHAGAACPWRNTPPGTLTCVAVVHGELLLMRWTQVGDINGEMSPVRGTAHCSRGSTHLSDQEQKFSRLTDHNPHSPSPCTVCGRT